MKKGLIILSIFILVIIVFSQNIFGQNISFSFSPRLWGIDFFLFLNDFPVKFDNFASIQTIIGIGGGWESYGYFRDSSNNPVQYDESSAYSFYFNRIDIIGTFGLSFMFFYNEFYGKYLTQIRFKFVTDYQSYEQENSNKATYLSQSNLIDKEGIFQNSFLIEFYLDLLKYSSKYHSMRGLDFYIGYEIFPQFINQIANFTRLLAKIRGYLPILEKEEISIYLANRVLFYYIPQSSDYIPVSALTMGSLGYTIRGVKWCQYEGTIKLNNNFDIRIFFPKIFGQSLVIPGIVLFFDCGINDYERLDGIIDFSKTQFSTGIGLITVVLGIDLIDFYLDYNINEKLISFALRFSLYF